MVIRKRRKTRRNAPRRRTRTMKKSGTRRSTKSRRRKATTGAKRKRPVVYVKGGKIYAPRRSKTVRKGMRINPRRRRSVRRNPKLKLIPSMATLQNQALPIAAGIFGGMIGIGLADRAVAALPVQVQKFRGGVHIILGTLVASGKNKQIKTFGYTLAGVGLYDILSQFIPQLPQLPEAELLSGMPYYSANYQPALAANYQPVSANYQPVAADYDNEFAELDF